MSNASKVGIVSVFMLFNLAVLLTSQNLQNRGHMNIKGFIVPHNFPLSPCFSSALATLHDFHA